jgi:hypothetical protein
LFHNVIPCFEDVVNVQDSIKGKVLPAEEIPEQLESISDCKAID